MIDKDTAISVQGVSKLYRIGRKEETHDSLGGLLLDIIKSPITNFRKYRSLYNFSERETQGSGVPNQSQDIIWALNNVSFEIKKGEVVGIIGMNGAGKSTLLKILSRITPPTRGKVIIDGRVNSLLEVGTGFHMELTGRENIYLNGAILGMRKREIDRKFDDIVEFSEIEKFLDTPVKRYSSGMRVRLAFAVAAHIEPEILIVDEVLAVGDAAFQKKCIDKMQDVGKEGRTILFVSHNMQAVTRMCERVILLNNGAVMLDATAHEAVSMYLKAERETTAEKVWPILDEAPGGDVARLLAVRVRSENGSISEVVDIRRPVGVEIEYEVLRPDHVFMVSFALINEEGVNVCVAIDQDPKWRGKSRKPGKYKSTGWLPGNLMSEGLLTVNVTLWKLEPSRAMEFHQKDVVAFQVIDSLEGDSARGDWVGNLPGIIRPLLKWTTECDEKPPTVELAHESSNKY